MVGRAREGGVRPSPGFTSAVKFVPDHREDRPRFAFGFAPSDAEDGVVNGT